ncbi:MAG: filamentous hemagglutinin N-terminal domain-containing protein [Nostoc sp. ChiSLP02]|nr:filamentous hemagglutinin N-terminal domain-containing protein [Nostoc sp. DedSLP05]MDZ8102338.1 filamentous hemagglutinin N-terminal domain-containing protein [Nostoc sp. DedSLP01]MDZ8188413.1 filamentous hemagglutinin N-terminal domain-containing protein [Nostoc sp. ChiSLP02]
MSRTTKYWQRWDWKLEIFSFLAMSVAIASTNNCAFAQINPDSTLPNNSSVTKINDISIIEGGTQAGKNLFHSFDRFSVSTGGTAYFNNAVDVQNIISRVTGKSVSNIDGFISVNGNANLFLLNPNGIIFGPNALLNIGGSFLASTANSLKFPDGKEFSVNAPQNQPLLSINVPIGLQYGDSAKSILVNQAFLLPEKTLALVGGNVTLDNAVLSTTDGQVNLAGISEAGTVGLNVDGNNLRLNFPNDVARADVSLINESNVVTSGSKDNRDIQIWGRNIKLEDGSRIATLTEGAESGGNLDANASESVEVIGSSKDGLAFSGLTTTVLSKEDIGAGGNLTLETGRLVLRDGAWIGTDTNGKGPGGNLTIKTRGTVEVIGTSVDGSFPSELRSAVGLGATGAGGDLTIETGRLSVRDGARIGTITSSTGTAGQLAIEAGDAVEAIGSSKNGLFQSSLFSKVESAATGAGGDLTIQARQLIVGNGGQIEAKTYGAGATGNLTVKADEAIAIFGSSADGLLGSTLGTFVYSETKGAGGNVTLETKRLSLRDGAQIQTSSFGQGATGNLTVKARDAVEVSGTTVNGYFPSQLTTQIFSGTADAGGNLTLETGKLSLREGGQIRTSTFGEGKAGNLTIKARDVVEVIGSSANFVFPSELSSAVESGATGAGGNVTVETGRLMVRDGAKIQATTSGSAAAGDLLVKAGDLVEVIGTTANGNFSSEIKNSANPGATGAGGNLTLETGRLILRDGGQIEASTFGEGPVGNLAVVARRTEVIGSSKNGLFGSAIRNLVNAGATGAGGNLTLETGQLTIQDGGQIQTSTFGQGNAGNLAVKVGDVVKVIGTTADGRFPSGLFSQANPGATGAGGNLTLETGKLFLQDGGQIRSSTYGEGAAGQLSVAARDAVEIIGSSNNGEITSGLFTTTQGTGTAGNLTINTGQLTIRDGAQASTATFSAGLAGNLSVSASQFVALIGTSKNGEIASGLTTGTEGTGNAGNLTINTGQLFIQDGGQASTATDSAGRGGNLSLNASQSVTITGTSTNGKVASGLITGTQGIGSAGDLTINTGQLIVRDGAQVTASTYGDGQGGNLNVNASQSTVLSGTSDRFFSGLLTQTTGTGVAGDLTINTGQLIVQNGAQASTATFSAGRGGNLNVTASKSVTLSGNSVNNQFFSSLTTGAQGTGAAGDLTIDTQQLSVRDGAEISAGTFSDGAGGKINISASESVVVSGISADGRFSSSISTQTEGTGTAGDLRINTGKLSVGDRAQVSVSSLEAGKAGNLEVRARSIQLDDRGVIIATTSSGNGGNITLQDLDLLLMRRNSQISTTAGTTQAGGNGGNIDIDAKFIAAVPLENSDITANAFEGKGGNVTINATSIFGMVVRSREDLVKLLGTNKPDRLNPFLLPTSDITAISQQNPSFNGVITINSPGIDPNQGLVNLPNVPVDTEITQGCTAGGTVAKSEFNIVGRGGLPPNPGEALNTDAVQVDLVTLNPKVAVSPTPNSTIVEAQDWAIDANGNVTLIANVRHSAGCQHSER